MTLDRCYSPNPDYGTGSYRRRIVLEADLGAVTASVLDSYHDMGCVLRHDGETVTAVEGHVSRAPFTTCPAAPEALAELVGLPLAMPRTELYGSGRTRRNCTHLLDIAALAMALAAEGTAARRFDFLVPDEAGGSATIEAAVDGKTLHRWTVANGVIVAPEEFAGQRLMGGFAPWAMTRFEGIALDAALHLQKAVFVGRGRRVLLDRPIGPFRQREPERIGACYSFSEPQFSIARDVPDYVRDFSRGLPDDAQSKALP